MAKPIQRSEVIRLHVWANKSQPMTEIKNIAYNREVVFIKPKHYREYQKKGSEETFTGKYIVNYRGFKVQDYKFMFKIYNDYLNCFKDYFVVNTYMSLATYKDYPLFIGDYSTRLRLMREYHEKQSIKDMTGYDLLIDVDSPKHDVILMAKIKGITENIIELLDEYNIQYNLRFSGKGYHVVIPYCVFSHLGHHFNPDKDIENNIYTFYNDITDKLKDLFGTYIDTGLHDSRRVTKVPYSLVFYTDKTLIAWTFMSKQEFLMKNFKDFIINDDRIRFAGFENIFMRKEIFFNYNKSNVKDTTEFLKFIGVKV